MTDPNCAAVEYRMADVGAKRPTRRRAVAVGDFDPGNAFQRIIERRLPKGDALLLAQVAGIQGAKLAPQLLPLCHPLPLSHVDVICMPIAECGVIRVYCEVACEGRTGVEMEALAGVSAALLTLYDLVKPVQPVLTIAGVRLLFKEGGKHGLWLCPDGLSPAERERFRPRATATLEGARCAVITLSDRAAIGAYADRSGPVLVDALARVGVRPESIEVLPDGVDPLAGRLRALSAAGLELVLCSGGTGLGPRDLSPEALSTVMDRAVSGIGELLRSESRHHTDLAWLSRSAAGLVGSSLVILLPGSPRAVAQCMDILEPVLAHALATLRGAQHDPRPGSDSD